MPRTYIDAAYQRLTPAVRRNILRPYRAADAGDMPAWEARFRSAARTVALLALWGEGDPYLPDAFAERFDARLVVRFPGAGHRLPVTETGRVGAAISDVFAAPPA